MMIQMNVHSFALWNGFILRIPGDMTLCISKICLIGVVFHIDKLKGKKKKVGRQETTRVNYVTLSV